MHVEFNTGEMREAIRSIKKIFSKGPVGEEAKEDVDTKDCIVASKADGFIIEAARSGLYCRSKIKASVESEGSFVISRGSLCDVKWDHETTVFKLDEKENRILFRSGTFDGNIPVSQAVEVILNQKPSGIPKVTLTLPCKVLQEGIKRISFTPTIQRGLLDFNLKIIVKGKTLVMTTNDSYRAAAFKAELEDAVPEATIVTTRPFFASVVSSIPSDEKVGIGLSDKGLRIKGGTLDVFQPALQELELLDIPARIKTLLETKAEVRCKIDAKKSRDSIIRASSVVPAQFGEIRLVLKFNVKKGIAVPQVDSSRGGGQDPFEAQDIELKDSDEVVVSSKYISECLSLLDGEVEMLVWDRTVMLRSESLNTTLILPQLT